MSHLPDNEFKPTTALPRKPCKVVLTEQKPSLLQVIDQLLPSKETFSRRLEGSLGKQKISYVKPVSLAGAALIEKQTPLE